MHSRLPPQVPTVTAPPRLADLGPAARNIIAALLACERAAREAAIQPPKNEGAVSP
jgi:hypothetical protein